MCLNCSKATVDCSAIPLDGMMEWPCPACGHIYALTRSSKRSAKIAETGKMSVNALVMIKVDRGEAEPLYLVLRKQLTARTGFPPDELLRELRRADAEEYGPESCISAAIGIVTIVGNDDHPHHLFEYVNTILEPSHWEYAQLLGIDPSELDPEDADPFVLDAELMRGLFQLDGPKQIKRLH